jgi:hypothetical protein
MSELQKCDVILEPVEIHDNESVASILARLALTNYFRSVEHLLLELEVERSRIFRALNHSTREIAMLSDLIGISPERFARTCFAKAEDPTMRMVNGTSVPDRLIERAHRRFAPASLAISPHIRTLWHVRIFPFCEETWQILRDSCDECGTKQGWYHAAGVERCDHCVSDLSRMSARTIPVDDRKALREAIGLVSHDPDRVEASLQAIPIPGINAKTALDLIVRLVPVVDNTLQTVRGMFRVGVDPKRLSSAVASAWCLLRSWPDAPLKFFGEKLADAKESHQDGNAGRTMKFLRWSSGHNAAPSVREIVTDLRESCRLEGNDRTSKDGRLLVEPKEVERMLRREGSEVASIRRKGGLATVFAIKNHHPCPMHFADDVDALKGRLNDRITLPFAAAPLGVPYYAISQFIEDGLLEPLDHVFWRKFDDESTVRKSSVEALLRKLDLNTRTDLRDTKPIAVLSRVIGGGLKPWHSIVRLLLNGTVPYEMPRERRGVLRMRVPRSAVEEFAKLEAILIPHPTTPTAMSIRDAGEVLNLSAVSYTEVFRRMRGGVQRKGDTSVSMGSTLELAREHMSISEFAGRLRLSTQKAQNKADAVGLFRVGNCGFLRSEAKLILRAWVAP